MKIVVIGAVAAGTSAMAKARRNSEDIEIVCYTAGKDISYSGCGIPYYIEELPTPNVHYLPSSYRLPVHAPLPYRLPD